MLTLLRAQSIRTPIFSSIPTPIQFPSSAPSVTVSPTSARAISLAILTSSVSICFQCELHFSARKKLFAPTDALPPTVAPVIILTPAITHVPVTIPTSALRIIPSPITAGTQINLIPAHPCRNYSCRDYFLEESHFLREKIISAAFSHFFCGIEQYYKQDYVPHRNQ